MRKRLAHIQVVPKMSGVQPISFDILKNLDPDEFDLYLICGDGTEIENFKKRFQSINVKVIVIPELKREICFSDIKAFFRLLALFKRHKIDIVHTNSTKPGVIARIAAKFAGVRKIVHTVHGIAFHAEMNTFKRLLYWLVEYFSCFFGDVNVLVNKHYLMYYPFINNMVVYNGVDFGQFTGSKSVSDQLHFAFMARLDDQKNPFEFIEAIKIIHDTHPHLLSNVKFTLAGDGELAEQCRFLIVRYGLENKVNMPGWIIDKNKFFSDVDVICQPSKWEAFGLVFAEAAYFKIPSIARAVEGVPEVIINGKTGLLYNKSEDELSVLMIKLINNPSLISELGEQAYSYVTNKFSLNTMLANYKQLYTS